MSGEHSRKLNFDVKNKQQILHGNSKRQAVELRTQLIKIINELNLWIMLHNYDLEIKYIISTRKAV